MKNSKSARLNRAYSKKIKIASKDFFTKKDVGLVLFVEYLRYLRDTLIIKVPTALTNESAHKTKIATLATAIAEFDTYRISQEESKKTFHWNNFCELIKLNMEEWLEPNDSV
jgi:hypothetical protein